MEMLLKAVNIKKIYGGREILKNVNFELEKGKTMAIMGHNGCGKSTLLRIVAGLTNPDAGQIIRLTDKIKIEYMPDPFPGVRMTPESYLRTMAKLQGLTDFEAKERCRELFQTYYMEGMEKTPMKNLSKGSLQKIAVCQALLTLPDLLLMDEPLSGMDEDSKEVFIHQILDLKKQGVTILLACHEKELAISLADITYHFVNGELEQENEWNERINKISGKDVPTFL